MGAPEGGTQLGWHGSKNTKMYSVTVTRSTKAGVRDRGAGTQTRPGEDPTHDRGAHLVAVPCIARKSFGPRYLRFSWGSSRSAGVAF